MLWPIVISLLVLGLAYLLYRMLPEIIDQDMSFLWIIGFFLLIYIGAAIYLSRALPALSGTPATQTETDEFLTETLLD